MRFQRAEKRAKVKLAIQQLMNCIMLRDTICSKHSVFWSHILSSAGASYALIFCESIAFLRSFFLFYSAIEIGPYSLYRKKVTSAFKLNRKIVRSQNSFLTSQAINFGKSHHFLYVLYVHSMH